MQTITNVAANSFLTVIEGDPVNIEIKNNDVKFECYPNPFDQNLSVKFENMESFDFNIDLFDFNGKLIVQHSVSSGDSQINYFDLNLEKYKLTPGIYCLKIRSEKIIKTIKLIKH